MLLANYLNQSLPTDSAEEAFFLIQKRLGEAVEIRGQPLFLQKIVPTPGMLESS